MPIFRLRFEKMDFVYSSGEKIFDNVEFNLPLNQCVWIQGAPGSGRTTLLKLISGTEIPTKGHYFIDSLDVPSSSFHEFLEQRLKIGFASDEGGLLNNKTIKENIELQIHYHGREDLLPWVEELIETLELQPYLNDRPALVRGAIRKAAVLARAMVMKPEVLVLDRPFSGLDESCRVNFTRLLQRSRHQKWLRHIYMAGPENEYMLELIDGILKIENQSFQYKKKLSFGVAA